MVVLTEEQNGIFDEVSEYCNKVEIDLSVKVNINEPHEIQYRIEQLRNHLSNSSDMLSKASSLYDLAKGQVAEMIIKDEQLLKLKQGVLKMYIGGKVNKFNTLHVRTKETIKSLTASISSLVSLLSMEKEKIKHEI